jgi:hypothetical protein
LPSNWLNVSNLPKSIKLKPTKKKKSKKAHAFIDLNKLKKGVQEKNQLSVKTEELKGSLKDNASQHLLNSKT